MLGRLPRLMPLCPMQVLDSHGTKNQHLRKGEKIIKRRPGHRIKNKEDRIEELKKIASETVDIRGIGFYSLGSVRKNLNKNQLVLMFMKI